MLITPRSRPPSLSPFLLLPASRRDEKSRRPPFGLVRPSGGRLFSLVRQRPEVVIFYCQDARSTQPLRARWIPLSVPDCLPLFYLSSRCTPCMQNDRTREGRASIFHRVVMRCKMPSSVRAFFCRRSLKSNTKGFVPNKASKLIQDPQY